MLASPPCPLQPALGSRPSVLSGPGWALLSPAPGEGQRVWMAPSGSQPMLLVAHVVFFLSQGIFLSLPSPPPLSKGPGYPTAMPELTSPSVPQCCMHHPIPHGLEPIPLVQGWQIFGALMDSKHSSWFLLPTCRAEHGPSPPAAAAALRVCPHSGARGVWPRRCLR